MALARRVSLSLTIARMAFGLPHNSVRLTLHVVRTGSLIFGADPCLSAALHARNCGVILKGTF